MLMNHYITYHIWQRLRKNDVAIFSMWPRSEYQHRIFLSLLFSQTMAHDPLLKVVGIQQQ